MTSKKSVKVILPEWKKGKKRGGFSVFGLLNDSKYYVGFLQKWLFVKLGRGKECIFFVSFKTMKTFIRDQIECLKSFVVGPKDSMFHNFQECRHFFLF